MQPRALSFDQTVWLTVILLFIVIGAVIARGDQRLLQVIRMSPAPESTGTSTRVQIDIQFDQRLAPPSGAVQLSFTPALTGQLQIAVDRLLFMPATPLQSHTTYTATLTAGLRGAQSGSLQEALTWHFTTGGVQIAYTAIDGEGQERLFLTDAQLKDGSNSPAQPIQITSGPLRLWDYSVSPTSGAIVYSALKADGTSDLWQFAPGDSMAQLLVPCPNAVCNSTAWSPDGKLLAYARRNGGDFGAAAFSPPRLWLFEPATGETVPLFPDSQKLAFEPSWSTDGQWLSYVAPDTGGVGVVNLQSGADTLYATASGETGRWHPQENRLLYSLLHQIGEQYVSHLLLVDPVLGTTVNVSGEDALVEDTAPSWSPDGQWIALRRKELTGSGATPGKQLWRIRADGSAAQPLTADPAYDHSQPLWSPDGRYLLYHKLPLKGPEVTLSV
ncbi:MAG: Ig-like domain-containing protein [Caldilineaceae bacterium]